MRAPVETRRSDELARLLTDRERDVLAHVARGETNKQIARALAISPATVKVHVERIIGKLGVADRTGSMEAGKIANVVAWSGEPLTKDAKPRYVFVDGELFEPDPPPSPSPSPSAGVWR